MKTALTAANVVAFGMLVVSYLIEHSSCMGFPSWVVPVLTVINLALATMAQSPIAAKLTPAP